MNKEVDKGCLEPKVVVIGGGTGLSNLLRGLKQFTSNLTAVVTVADNGGGSGILRREMKMLPPGDIRNCILALANTETILTQLLQYRFTEGSLKGQSFGNLFLAAMNGISESFEEAVKKMSDVLAITGKVLPVTLEEVHLCAKLADGEIIQGETEIVEECRLHNRTIQEIYLSPENVKANKEVLEAIEQADFIILGPGSLYTSIIPNLLIEEVAKAVGSTQGEVIYISNVMTQPGETDGYSVEKHLEAIEKYIDRNVIRYIVLNSQNIPRDLIERYGQEGSEPVSYDSKNLTEQGYILLEGPIISLKEDLIRHHSKSLAKLLATLFEKSYKNVVQ